MALRKARTADRDRAVDTINSAYADGQLNEAEHEARVTKALKARTLVQLDRLTLDLQKPASPPEPLKPSSPPTLREQFRRNSEQQRKEWRNVPRWQKVLIGTMMALAIGGIGVAVVLDDGPDDRAASAAGQGSFALTASGIEAFITSYEAKFKMTGVVSAVFATDGVMLDAPTADGKARHEKWHYRGGNYKLIEQARANHDGQGPIDLVDIDLSRLEDNLAEAKSTLGVEEPHSILIWVEREYLKSEPSVRIQVSNKFQEIGMLITDLTGQRVIHRSPFAVR